MPDVDGENSPSEEAITFKERAKETPLIGLN